MKLLAFLATIIVGIVGSSIFSSWINFPEAGVIFAIATMGVFIMAYLDNSKK